MTMTTKTIQEKRNILKHLATTDEEAEALEFVLKQADKALRATSKQIYAINSIIDKRNDITLEGARDICGLDKTTPFDMSKEEASKILGFLKDKK